MCFCVVKKAVSGWKPVLGRSLTMEWMSGVSNNTVVN